MTNHPIGECPYCGRVLRSSGPCICKYLASFNELVKTIKDLDPEYSKVVDDHFWELF